MLLGLAAATSAHADDTASGGTFALRGSIGAEARVFTMAPAYPAQKEELVQTSLSASAKSNGARFTLAVATVKYVKNAMKVNGSWKISH